MPNINEGWGDGQSPQPNFEDNNDFSFESTTTGTTWDDAWKDGNSQSTSSDGLIQPRDDWQTPNSQATSWDAFASQQGVTGQGSMTNQMSSPQPVQQQQGGWGNTQQGASQQGTWTDPQPMNQDQNSWNSLGSTPDWTGQQDGGMAQPIPESPPKKFSFSPKVVGCILCGVILVVALLLSAINSIKIKPKNTQQQQVAQTQQSAPQSVAQPSGKNDVALIYVPDTTVMNYSGDIYEVNGTVANKLKFVQGKQVIYCIQISLAFGSSSETVNFYCNYATYNAVSSGELVLVKYQQVSDGYISVNEVTK